MREREIKSGEIIPWEKLGQIQKIVSFLRNFTVVWRRKCHHAWEREEQGGGDWNWRCSKCRAIAIGDVIVWQPK